MKKTTMILLLVLLNLFRGTAAIAGEETPCKTVTVSRLLKMINSGEKLEIIDYRPSEDYYKGHIAGARLLDTNEKKSMKQKWEFLILQWKKDGTTGIIVDDDGKRSNTLCKNMKKSTGYTKIYSLEKGMSAWNGQVEKEYIPIFRNKFKRLLGQ